MDRIKYESGYDSDASSHVYDDRDTLARSRQALGLARDYLPKLTARNAFREYFQNWIDGMIETNSIERDDIDVRMTESETEWLARAFRLGCDDMIGFIRFDKTEGTLEFTNFKAKLARRSLEMGISSKRQGHHNFAGVHGEGFKVASLVMARENYQVRYESSSFYWNFKFGGTGRRRLYCNLSPMQETKLAKLRAAESTRLAQNGPRKEKSNIWEDFSVKIGKVYSREGSSVDWVDFSSWIKVALALSPPEKVFKTRSGDLIMDKSFGGRLYLKGLYLDKHSKAFKFSYNYRRGAVNRDREQLLDEADQAATLADIWAEEIAKGNSIALEEYVKMLMEAKTEYWGDVHLAERYIRKETAQGIWTYLKKLDTENTFFYHVENTTGKDLAIIAKCLKKIATPLPVCIWKPLAKYSLVRTPEAQRYYLLYHASASKLIDTTYSLAMKRALKAALALDAKTSSLDLLFKTKDDAELDVLLEGSILFINDKWLDFKAAHHGDSCWVSDCEIQVDDLPCNHSVSSLYRLIWNQVFEESSENQTSGVADDHLCRVVAEGLRQMPRMINIVQGENCGELSVKWVTMESNSFYKSYGIELVYSVALHRESSCSALRNNLILSQLKGNTQQDDTHQVMPCDCPRQFILDFENGVTFRHLTVGEAYFAAISCHVHQAFINFSSGSETPADRPKTPNVPENASLDNATPNREFNESPSREPVRSQIIMAMKQELDLQGQIDYLFAETQQLYTTRTKLEARLAEDAYKMAIHVEDVKVARAIQTEQEKLTTLAVSEKEAAAEKSSIQIKELEDTNSSLRGQVTQLQMEKEARLVNNSANSSALLSTGTESDRNEAGHSSLVSALQDILIMIDTALALRSEGLKTGILRNVVGMISSVLATRGSATIKRERNEKEKDSIDSGIGGRASKRPRRSEGSEVIAIDNLD